MSEDFFIEKAQRGIFMKFEELGKYGKEHAYNFDRDKTRNAILGIKLVKKNLICAKNSEGFIEIANRKKAELLGIIYYHKPWKKFIWEQCDGVLMADNCMQELTDFMKSLYGSDLK